MGNKDCGLDQARSWLLADHDLTYEHPMTLIGSLRPGTTFGDGRPRKPVETAVLFVSTATLASNVASGYFNKLLKWKAAKPGREIVVAPGDGVTPTELVTHFKGGMREVNLVLGSQPYPKFD